MTFFSFLPNKVLARGPNTDTEFDCTKYIVVTFPMLSMLFTAKC